MGWPGVMSVLPTFRANGSAGCLRELFPSMARAGVRAFQPTRSVYESCSPEQHDDPELLGATYCAFGSTK